MIRHVAAFIIAVIAVARPALAADVDWKLYGGTSGIIGDTFCFYDERSIIRPKPGFVRYWSKCLSASDLNSIDPKKHYYRAMIDMAVSRIANAYLLPITKAEKLQKDDFIAYVGYEAAADVADDLERQSLGFSELDCLGRRQQILSFEFKGRTSTNLGWTDIAPEGNGAAALAILCP